MKFHRPLIVAALALGFGLPASAQSTILGIRDVDEQLEQMRENAQIRINRGNDVRRRFGPSELREGLSGSLSLGYSNFSGTRDKQDLSFGARLTDVHGPLVQTLGFIANYSELNGVRTTEDILATYDLTYDWNSQFYGFVLGRIVSDGLARTAGEVRNDAFIGVGPGIRVIDRPDMTWRLQVGVGQSYLKYGNTNHTSEVGGVASSRFYVQLGENVFLTDDIDILSSKSATRANNDLGVNFKMTDALSTRISYVSEYNDSRAKKTENELSFAVVYGF